MTRLTTTMLTTISPTLTLRLTMAAMVIMGIMEDTMVDTTGAIMEVIMEVTTEVTTEVTEGDMEDMVDMVAHITPGDPDMDIINFNKHLTPSLCHCYNLQVWSRLVGVFFL